MINQTEAVENFLKAVYVLQQKMERVPTNALADQLGVKAPSITDMARRMVEAGLIDYEKYHGVLLTPQGEILALRVIRRHRLIELYLVNELGYELQEVHDEAERLEHAVSDRFVQAIARKLGDPIVDPHGDPIPTDEGTVVKRDLIPLTQLPLYTSATIAQLEAKDSEMLQYMLDREFRLNTEIEVTEREPFEGPLTVQVNDQAQILGYKVALCIWVERA
ncbi:MAG: metal-dependent transcriptional regulator [Anaerolineae bacterium]|nr:metal-dependent transcriptional regulator [Anaerolineae bacterium]